MALNSEQLRELNGVFLGLQKQLLGQLSEENDNKQIIYMFVSNLFKELKDADSRLKEYFDQYLSQLSVEYLKTSIYSKAIQDFKNIYTVNQLINNFSVKIKAAVYKILDLKSLEINLLKLPEVNALTQELLNYAYDPEEHPLAITDEIANWISTHYSSIDMRARHSDDRRLRRLDSLSRLLSLNMKLSACVTVCIPPPDEPVRIVISSNVANDNSQPHIIEMLTSKWSIIQKFLSEYDRTTTDIDELALNLVEELKKTRCYSNDSELLRSAYKIIQAVHFDEETFSTRDRLFFTSVHPPIILLPQKNEEKMDMLVVDGEKIDNIPLTEVPLNTSVKNIHAEQLMAYYFLKEKKLKIPTEKPLFFGISKLCCDTCFQNLDTTLITVRGNHQQSYQGVVNLLNPGLPAAITTQIKRPAITKSWASPTKSPAGAPKKSTPIDELLKFSKLLPPDLEGDEHLVNDGNHHRSTVDPLIPLKISLTAKLPRGRRRIIFFSNDNHPTMPYLYPPVLDCIAAEDRGEETKPQDKTPINRFRASISKDQRANFMPGPIKRKSSDRFSEDTTADNRIGNPFSLPMLERRLGPQIQSLSFIPELEYSNQDMASDLKQLPIHEQFVRTLTEDKVDDTTMHHTNSIDHESPSFS
jgi:hypothetical protein